MDVSMFDNYKSIEISDILKALRKEKKITQEELAKKLDITQSAVSQFESGQTKLTDQQVKVILTALDESLSDFYMFYHDVLSRRSTQKRLEERKKECEALPDKIMTTAYKLNEQGQRKVLDYIDDLLQIDKYKYKK